MLLHQKGSKPYFDKKLLSLLKKKKNDDVRKILKEYQPRDLRRKQSASIYCTRDGTQATLLHYAAEYGNAEIVKQLIDSNSEIDAQDEFGRTPLMLALMGEHELVIQALIIANANVRLTNDEGRSALQMIFELKTVSSEIFNILVQYMLLGNILKSMSPDMVVTKLRKKGITLNQVAVLGNIQFMKLLLDQGYTVDEKDSENGKTALHTAVETHDLVMIKTLIEHNADVDALDATGSTPLRYLNPRGIDSNSSDKVLDILSVLLNRMRLLTASNNDGRMQISDILIFGRKEAVKLILQWIDNLYVYDEKGNSVVHYLAWNEDTQVIQLLRGRHFDVNVRNRAGYTPLHWAASESMSHAVKFLLENKADVHSRDALNDTPLRRLFETLNTSKLDDAAKCIQLLIEYGSNPFDNNVDTIFDIVSQIYSDTVAAEGELKEPTNILKLMEPIIALLALNKKLVAEIAKLARSKIEMQPWWIKYFDMCKKQVNQMSKTTIYGSVTLLKFLTGSKRVITGYVRNRELVSELEKIITEFQTNSPYLNMIQKRFTEAIELAELKKLAIAAICQIINLKNNAHYFTAEYIIDYLSNEDMKNMNSVMLSA